MTFPTQARAVIVGGGIIGCSTAYHLASLGWEVVLLEAHKLTSGTTFHAAGLVGQLRSSANITELLGYSVKLYDTLEAQTGQATGWKRNGGLRLACNAERWTEVKRQATTARSFGLDMQLLTPLEAQSLWPLMDVSDVIGAAYLPTDGQANPSDITLSLAKGARMAGAQIIEDCKALSVTRENGVITGVQTAQGFIKTGIVIACCGQWTRDFAAPLGVTVPLVSMEHQYMVTEPIEGVTRDLPTLRDPDRLTYWKEEVGGLVMGGYEPNPKPWAISGIPEGFHYTLLSSDYDHFEQIMELALGRVPALQTAGIKTLTNGPESFTPDGNFILGEAPEQPGFFVGAGFNAFGIASGGGAGMALAEWVAKGEPPMDLWPVDIRRFGRPHFDTDWVRTRTVEAYGKHYTMAWPSEEHDSARPARRSPLYDRLARRGAVFGEKMGWERPNWFAAPGEVAKDIYTYERPNWFAAVAREHRAAREAAVLIDQTSFAKFWLQGPDAESALQRICANDVGGPVGALTYTQMLNDRGGIEADLTVVRTGPEAFYIVTGTGFATRDFDWIRRGLAGANAQLTDVTSGTAVLSLMGPKARDILSAVTRADVSNAAFPFGTAQMIAIAGAPVRALRVSYVGELGWELHLPVEYATSVFDALHMTGAAHGLVDAGYRAIESLRLEKGYRAWGSDIGPDSTPYEAGLGFAVAQGKAFRGQPALLAQKQRALTRRLATFTAAPEVILLGRETVFRNGERVGYLSSGGFGHTLGKAIGMGYLKHPGGVTKDWIASGSYELEVAMQRVPCEVTLSPLYDPAGARLKS
ncbi:FAD-dependent oxidoreductase [Salipiger sp. 1_MG-2023]|uniref:GcvT family protein n=1 Tax=Salipiger sp. 1_MG-2023 TaxID=3062665 RepID=UPI0026E1717D|nr:FAD-dependent oxidoreductase [Salipiger sp. 1_MG-2023]MDO6587603.1 FAD-dependent oxidoreductase [Salipiger sp. 1_MG-2023]